MVITIESQAKPCPGVERAINMTEELLRRGEVIYATGQLIHNQREIERLESLNLRQRDMINFSIEESAQEIKNEHFLVRAHGESEETLKKVYDCGLHVVDATCPIVRHSQELVEEHVGEGWRIIIVGRKDHPEVVGLLARTCGCGSIISSAQEAENHDFEQRSLLLAQTTVDPKLFHEVCRVLSKRLSRLKIADTTCRYLRNRQKQVADFSKKQDIVIIVGGLNSANCQLLYETAYQNNQRSYHIEKPNDIDMKWFKDGQDKIGISGGASTPRWQLEEVYHYLEKMENKKYPKGLKNKKGGIFSWLIPKKKNITN